MLYEDLIYLWLSFLIFEFFPNVKLVTGFPCLIGLLLKDAFFLWFLFKLRGKLRFLPSVLTEGIPLLLYTFDLWFFSLKHYFSIFPLSSLIGLLWFLHYYLLLRVVVYRMSKNYIKLLGGFILPIVLVVLCEAVFDYFKVSSPFVEWGLLLTLFLIAPAIMIKVFPLKPLEDPYWLELVRNFLARTNTPVRGIYLLENLSRRLYTAGIVGFLPGVRYLFFSEPLLEVLTPEEVLGVLGHEVGHIKRRHAIWLLVLLINLPLFLLAVLLLFLFGFSVIFPNLAKVLLKPGPGFQTASAVYFILLSFLYIRYVFAYFLRQFEREADVFSFSLLGNVQPIVSALYKIGELSGQLYKKSWHHYGVLERIEFLLSLKDPFKYLKEKGKKLRIYIVLWLLLDSGILWLLSSETILKKVYQLVTYIL